MVQAIGFLLSVRYETVKDEDIEMPAVPVQFGLRLYGIGDGRIAVESVAEPY